MLTRNLRRDVLFTAVRSTASATSWRAAPLPLEFHLSLETGDWLTALQQYQKHPFHCPPVDTFDLIKLVMHRTGVRVEDVKGRFNEKVRLVASLQKKTPDEVEWAAFWEALNNGDSKIISQALTGARIGGVTQQIGVAEACAVLLKSAGANWRNEVIECVPFSTVTRNNLVTLALERARWDVAVELLRNMRLRKTDVSSLWPLMATYPWQQGLVLISSCSKNAVPFNVALPHLLEEGCDLTMLSQHLEQACVLGDVEVVAPLVAFAVQTKNWNYVERAMEHLADIGTVSKAALNSFNRMCALHTTEAVCDKLAELDIPLHYVTIEVLERLRFQQ